MKWNKFKALRLTTFAFCLITGCSFQPVQVSDRPKIANEMEFSLRKELLDPWYPRAVDSISGGFLTTFTHDFKPTGSQDKMIVTQSRHVWTNSKASKRYPSVFYFKEAARHGFYFLRDFMWDKVNGGFYTMVDIKGNPKPNDSIKTAYGNAFGIYAMSAYYEASGDTAGLNLAKKAFAWLEQNSHDPIHKGYFQHLDRQGKPLKRQSSTPSTSELGYKDQNSSIHLLEAFAELYTVWPDPLVKTRLEEMLVLVRDVITSPKGTLTLFLHTDWKPVSFRDSSESVILKHRGLDHVSFGHDVETAYLMLEASHVLGIKDNSKTLTLAKKMVDHALSTGWDTVMGGFFDEGYYFKNRPAITITRDTKNWWAQAEGLNTLLMMADLFPNDRMKYFEKFKQLWTYAQTYLIDHQFGDWYEGGLDKEPHKTTGLKGHVWKATYHQYRALANCIDQLKQPKSRNSNKAH